VGGFREIGCCKGAYDIIAYRGEKIKGRWVKNNPKQVDIAVVSFRVFEARGDEPTVPKLIA
jgi:hypothetical protein